MKYTALDGLGGEDRLQGLPHTTLEIDNETLYFGAGKKVYDGFQYLRKMKIIKNMHIYNV